MFTTLLTRIDGGALRALLLWLAVGTVGCDFPWPWQRKPNVVLITIDTLRQDHVSSYDPDAARTPTLDRFASQGATFLEAHCDVTWTTPSMATTMLGIYSVHHGFRTTYQTLGDHHLTLAEMLREAGYATAAVIGSYPLASVYNLDQGFDSYDDRFTHALVDNVKGMGEVAEEGVAVREGESEMSRLQRLQAQVLGANSRRTDVEVSAVAIAKLHELTTSGGPFFLWVHYFGPHHVPDANKDVFTNLKNYLVEYPEKVVKTDAEVGRFLAALDAGNAADDTLVIIHSDHGESLGEHDYIGHGRFLYEDNLRIPLMMRWPRVIPPGYRTGELVGTVDITPTVLDATSATPPGRPFDGRSLLPITQGLGAGHRELYMETYAPTLGVFAEPTPFAGQPACRSGAARFGVLVPPLKYVLTEPRPLVDAAETPGAEAVRAGVKRRELYDIVADPGESTDRFLERLSDSGRLAATLERYRGGAASESPPSADASTQEHMQKLKSLGYAQ